MRDLGEKDWHPGTCAHYMGEVLRHLPERGAEGNSEKIELIVSRAESLYRDIMLEAGFDEEDTEYWIERSRL